MFNADRPILNSQQDRLGRSVFAKYLARCMLDQKDPDSLVIGLFGGWGVGKTSVINLVVEELNVAGSNMFDDEKPILLNFSPWSYSGQDQLIYNFFRRLSSALRDAPFLDHKERIIHLLELYVSFFTHKPIPSALQKKSSFWSRLKGHHQEAAYAWESGRDLTQVKAELNDLLRPQKHKIIIIIDNISRMYDFEIKQIFQIVKSIGDFANTTYLLAFDKEQVIHAINAVDNGGGEEYIEKIIQLPFDVPVITAENIEILLADRLMTLVATIPEDTWNAEYWADLYFSALKYLFKNCRDVTRYVNTLNFGYTYLRDVVNPVDFFALTAIEVFMPELYAHIRANKDLFSDLLDHVYEINQDEREKDKKRCNEIIAETNYLPREALLDLLMRLFPRLRRIYQPNAAFYHSDIEAEKLKRICSTDYFDVYFRIAMPLTQMEETEFHTIMAFAADTSAFDQALTRLNQDGRILEFLNHIDKKMIQSLPLSQIQTVISALLDNGDLFPTGVSGPLSLDTSMRIHRLIHSLLRRFNNREERFLILQTAISHANKSIYCIVRELREQAHEHMTESDTYLPSDYRDLTSEQLTSLQQLAVNRIENWASTNRLADHPQLLQILIAWREWGDAARCEQYVKTLTDTDRGLVVFLMIILHDAIQEAKTAYAKNPAWQQYLLDIASFIPPKSLEEHAKLLFEDNYFEKLHEEEQLALMIFLDLLGTPTNKIIPTTSQ